MEKREIVEWNSCLLYVHLPKISKNKGKNRWNKHLIGYSPCIYLNYQKIMERTDEMNFLFYMHLLKLSENQWDFHTKNLHKWRLYFIQLYMHSPISDLTDWMETRSPLAVVKGIRQSPSSAGVHDRPPSGSSMSQPSTLTRRGRRSRSSKPKLLH